MSYSIAHSDSTVAPIVIAPLTIDDQLQTDLYLNGRGIPNFGQGHQTNFLRLLENFASPTEPAHPMIGQLWYDKGTSTGAASLKVRTASGWISAISVPGDTPPGDPNIGTVWYNSVNNSILIWDGTTWVTAGNSAAQVGPVPPSNPTNGQFWYDTNVNYLKLYRTSTSSWVSASDDSLKYLALII